MADLAFPKQGAGMKQLAASLLVALAASAGIDCYAQPPASGASVVARSTALRSGDAVTGALPMTAPIHVEVALRLRNEAALDALIADNAKRQAQRLAPNLLGSEAFLANHAPTQAQAQVVADYLVRHGFAHVTIAPNRMLVSADGTAMAASQAFMTSFAQVRTHDGRIAYANDDEARVPATLAGTVLAVVGLQSVHMTHTFAQAMPNSVRPQVWQGHMPSDFQTIYAATLLRAGGFVPVGILSEGKISSVLDDVAALAAEEGISPIPTVVVNTNGTSADTSQQAEWDVDSQGLVGMGDSLVYGPPFTLIFYNIPSLSNADVIADFNTIVGANATKLVEAAVGECEKDARSDGSAAAGDALLKSAVAQGQTFVVPAGNAGADACGDGSLAPEWPASSPYVIAVAGTSLSTNGAQYLGESVWSKTGGSPSTFEPMPSWQAAFGVPGSKRGVPDVAFDGNPASGAIVYHNLVLTRMGGSGLSAALFAGFWEQVLGAWGPTFGYAGPALYALPVGDFHDVKSGGNGGETAGAGYDFASGRGSIKVGLAVTDSRALATPPPNVAFSVTGTGRTARFTDASTDPGATIVSRHWDFGDGSSSTVVNPSHVYATSGIYKVVETLVNNAGGSGSATQPFHAGAVQLLTNPGFETGTLAGWSTGQSSINSDPTYVRSGSYSLELHTQTAGTSQKVFLPAYTTSAHLVVNQWIYDPNGNLKPYTFQVIVTDTTDHVLQTFTNADASSAYQTYTYDLSAFIGENITLRFSLKGVTNSVPAIYLDDLAINTTN